MAARAGSDFAALFAAAPQPLAAVDARLEVLAASDAFRRIAVGGDPRRGPLAEALGRDPGPALRAAVAAVLAGEPPRTVLAPAPTGDRWPVAVTAVGGAALLAFAPAARAEHDDSAERLNILAEGLPQFVWTLDNDGEADFLNRWWISYTGMDREACSGRSWVRTVHPDDLAGLTQAWDEGRRRAQPYEAEARFLRAGDGAWRWHLVRMAPLLTEDGRIRHWVGTAIDIDGRKRAEADRRLSDERFRRIVETAFEGIWEVDADARTVYVNRRMAEMLRISPERLIGRTSFEFVFAEERALAEQRWHEQRDGQSGHGEMRMRREDGSELWIHCSTTPVFDERGRFTGAVGMFTDIGERKRAEEELARHDNKLATLGLLMAGMAHEINNPANFISISLPTLREAWETAAPALDRLAEDEPGFQLLGRDLDEARLQVVDLFDGVERGLARIRSIVGELNRFSRSAPERAEPVDVNAVVASAIVLLNHVITGRTTRFSVHYQSALPPVHGHFQRLEQVLINLVHNACLSLPSRDRAVTVATRGEGGEVVIEVGDEGGGIPPEVLPRLARPFVTTRSEGIGLGLYIADGIVRSYGGRLVLAPRPGGGTIATLRLPSFRSQADRS